MRRRAASLVTIVGLALAACESDLEKMTRLRDAVGSAELSVGLWENQLASIDVIFPDPATQEVRRLLYEQNLAAARDSLVMAVREYEAFMDP